MQTRSQTRINKNKKDSFLFCIQKKLNILNTLREKHIEINIEKDRDLYMKLIIKKIKQIMAIYEVINSQIWEVLPILMADNETSAKRFINCIIKKCQEFYIDISHYILKKRVKDSDYYILSDTKILLNNIRMKLEQLYV
jgi:hypothetical protein